ncbi:MAG: HD domain-containing phosphohydrolase [Vulcanimicrobiota bacterium]
MTESRILIVDDDTSVHRALKRLLARAGFNEVKVTDEPDRVIEFFETFDPDLMILDLNMPETDGFAVLTQLREKNPELLIKVPVIVLTGEGGRDNKRHALELGARDFLSKPCDPVELQMRVKGYLEIRHLHRRLESHNQELERRVRERTRELEDSKYEVIQRLMAAAEYRDDDTGEHILRMSQYSELIALEYGLDEIAADRILWASPMHDIGKIGIPDAVLLKPGKLTPEEWELMKTHCQIGAELLGGSNSETLRLAEIIALTHHEKWDGSGYPRGLRGDDIPIEGRIVAVADVFDALTSERPYKKAWAAQEAIEEIKRSSGSHFDPQVVDAFIRCLPGVEAISKAFGNVF